MSEMGAAAPPSPGSAYEVHVDRATNGGQSVALGLEVPTDAASWPTGPNGGPLVDVMVFRRASAGSNAATVTVETIEIFDDADAVLAAVGSPVGHRIKAGVRA